MSKPGVGPATSPGQYVLAWRVGSIAGIVVHGAELNILVWLKVFPQFLSPAPGKRPRMEHSPYTNMPLFTMSLYLVTELSK